MERHLHLLKDALPDFSILQFPTTHVKTGSHCQQNNQMGGAIAIVNFKWKSFIVEGSLYTDPMGLVDIMNSIHLHLDDYWVRSVNIYFLCTELIRLGTPQSTPGSTDASNVPPRRRG